MKKLVHDLPPAWPMSKLIGPSFIILGVGLGSGELILWPYLTANYFLTNKMALGMSRPGPTL